MYPFTRGIWRQSSAVIPADSRNDRRDDIKAELKADLIILLDGHGYASVDREEVYRDVFEQGALRVSENSTGDSPEARDSPRAKP